MNLWKKNILETLIDHYFKSFSETEGRRILRLRTSTIFANFNSVNHDEKVSYLEAAESLEQKGIVKLRWEKRNLLHAGGNYAKKQFKRKSFNLRLFSLCRRLSKQRCCSADKSSSGVRF